MRVGKRYATFCARNLLLEEKRPSIVSVHPALNYYCVQAETKSKGGEPRPIAGCVPPLLSFLAASLEMAGAGGAEGVGLIFWSQFLVPSFFDPVSPPWRHKNSFIGCSKMTNMAAMAEFRQRGFGVSYRVATIVRINKSGIIPSCSRVPVHGAILIIE